MKEGFLDSAVKMITEFYYGPGGALLLLGGGCVLIYIIHLICEKAEERLRGLD